MRTNFNLVVAGTLMLTLACNKEKASKMPDDEVAAQAFGFQAEQAFPGKRGTLMHGKLFGEDIVYEQFDSFALIQGDILYSIKDLEETNANINQGTRAQGAARNGHRWPDNIVYYELDGSIEPYQRTLILSAISHIETNSFIRFVQRSSVQTHWIKIVESAFGSSSSHIGMNQSGSQEIRLVDRTDNNLYRGVAIHEFLHAIGHHHEAIRTDRDEWVKIYWNNIDPYETHNFIKYKNRTDITTSGLDYGDFDFNSIMMYGSLAHSVNGQPTITKKSNDATFPSQRDRMSPTDIELVKLLYPPVWLPLAGLNAKEVASNGNGQIWAIDVSNKVFRWDVNKWTLIPGISATKIDLMTSGRPWVIDLNNQTHYFNGSNWAKPARGGGGAKDVTALTENLAWTIDMAGDTWKWDGMKWTRIVGVTAISIDLQANGNPWAVSQDGKIFQFNGSNWLQAAGGGGAKSIGAGIENLTWRVNSDQSVWRGGLSGWAKMQGAVVSIDGGANGKAVMINPSGLVHQYK